MERNKLIDLIDKYRSAESDVRTLERDYGISLYNSKQENFYNKYNYIIHSLLANLYSENEAQLIEEFTFDQLNITFDELYSKLRDGINKKQES